MDHAAEVYVGVCGRREVYNDLDVSSHIEKQSVGVDHDAEACVCVGVCVGDVRSIMIWMQVYTMKSISGNEL